MMKLVTALVFSLGLSTAHAYDNITTPTQTDMTWLVKNVYFEARNQGTAGRLAVMMVTLNRVSDPRFPNTIKGVVTQGGERRHRCQFSWYCDGKSDKIQNWMVFNEIEQLVRLTFPVVTRLTDITDGATFYHATYVDPKWSKTKRQTARIGDHIFYK